MTSPCHYDATTRFHKSSDSECQLNLRNGKYSGLLSFLDSNLVSVIFRIVRRLCRRRPGRSQKCKELLNFPRGMKSSFICQGAGVFEVLKMVMYMFGSFNLLC